jgi:hypothetical protein
METHMTHFTISHKALFLVLLAAICAGCGDRADATDREIPATDEARDALGATIPISSSTLEPPEKVYVLPVIFVPSDRADQIPHPTSRAVDVAGNPWVDPGGFKYAAFDQARSNASAHLQWARAKYERMLRRGDQSRGTFTLASWSAADAAATVHTAGVVKPWVFLSSRTESEVAAGGKPGEAAELMDALGCELQSCPFVFVVAALRDDPFKTGGYALNYGHNGGAGIVELPFYNLRYGHLEHDLDDCGPPGYTTLLSTLLHELGHAFGLSHLEVYALDDVPNLHGKPPVPGGQDCAPLDDWTSFCQGVYASHPDADRYAMNCSASVMGYSPFNWTNGCITQEGTGACAFDPGLLPLTDLMIPGTMIPDDIRHLSINRRVFPELWFDAAADVPPYVGLQTYGGSAGVDVPGHLHFQVTSTDSEGGSIPNRAFGHTSNAVADLEESYTKDRMWRSKTVGENGWATLDLDFPTSVLLHRIRAFTGENDGVRKARVVEVQKLSFTNGWVACGSKDLSGEAEGEVIVSSSGSCDFMSRFYRIRFKAGFVGSVAVRGVRMFTLAHELFPPREPTAKTGFGETFGSHVSNVVGSEQIVTEASGSYQAFRHWHSSPVTPGAWVSMDVTFPDEVSLQELDVYTGYGDGVHEAVKVQIERRLGDGTFEFVDHGDIGGDGSLGWYGSATATTWRIAFRSSPAGAGYVVVRGLRFYGPQGGELFPVRAAP